MDLQALKSLFTSRSTGISCKGRWLTTEDLEAYLHALSQPGALTGALNYFRNVFRCVLLQLCIFDTAIHFYRKCRPLVSQMDIYVYLMLNIKQLFEKELMAFTSAIVAVMLTTDLLYCFKMLWTLHQRNVQHNIIYRMRTYFRSACVPVKNWFHALWAVHEQPLIHCQCCEDILSKLVNISTKSTAGCQMDVSVNFLTIVDTLV